MFERLFSRKILAETWSRENQQEFTGGSSTERQLSAKNIRGSGCNDTSRHKPKVISRRSILGSMCIPFRKPFCSCQWGKLSWLPPYQQPSNQVKTSLPPIFATSRFLVSLNPFKKNMKSTGSIAKPLILFDFIPYFPIPGILPRPWRAAATSDRLPRQRRCFQWTGRRWSRSTSTGWSTCPRSGGDELEMLYG